ncbi:MAG: cobalamin B12-binding domain-containing protein [Deltaproteobacteria bacterium]|nr:cobalamin B12-binding domain-containing protein [Deltaproteobacteria bacterium]
MTTDRPVAHVRIVGLHRRLVDADAGPTPSLGGYGDALAQAPYSLAAAYLKAAGDATPEIQRDCRIEIFDLVDDSLPADTEAPHEEFRLSERHVEQLAAGDPDAVCFSAYCWNVDAILEACARLKQRRPETLTVVGGRAVEDMAPALLRDHATLDHVVGGEAERSFVELLGRWRATGLPLAHDLPPGVFGRSPSGDVVSGPPAELVADLDTIPSPYLAGIVQPAPEGMMLELSRGCLNRCGYCAWNSAKTRRAFSQARLVDELRWALRNEVRHVTLIDSAINYEQSTLERFVAAAEAADPGRELRYTYNLRHELLTPAQVELLGRLRAQQVLLGMESLSEGAMRQSDREPLDRGRFQAALRLLRRLAPDPAASPPTVVGVVLGLPGDTLDGFQRTMDYLGELAAEPAGSPIGAVLVSLLQVFPGTTLWRRRAELGIRVPGRGIPYVLEVGTFPRIDLQRALSYLNKLRVCRPLFVKRPEGAYTLHDPRAPGPADDLRRLVAPRVPGAFRAGWMLRALTPLLDGDGVAVLTFGRHTGEAVVCVRLDRRNAASPCFAHTSRFNVYYQGDVPRPLRGPGLDALMREVVGLLRRNEGTWG